MRALILLTASVWKEYVEHTFVKGLGKGLLNKSCFAHFIGYFECTAYTPWPGDLRRQDYHYPEYYAEVLGLGFMIFIR